VAGMTEEVPGFDESNPLRFSRQARRLSYGFICNTELLPLLSLGGGRLT